MPSHSLTSLLMTATVCVVLVSFLDQHDNNWDECASAKRFCCATSAAVSARRSASRYLLLQSLSITEQLPKYFHACRLSQQYRRLPPRLPKVRPGQVPPHGTGMCTTVPHPNIHPHQTAAHTCTCYSTPCVLGVLFMSSSNTARPSLPCAPRATRSVHTARMPPSDATTSAAIELPEITRRALSASGATAPLAPAPAALDELLASSKSKGEGLFSLFNRRPKEAPAEKPVAAPPQPVATSNLATVAAAPDADGGVTQPALRADPPVGNPVRTTGSAGGWSAKARGEMKAKKAQAGEEAP